MPREIEISHLIVTRGGKPCVLLRSGEFAPKGVLVPVLTEFPTLIVLDKSRDSSVRTESRPSSIYARRDAQTMIDRTLKLAYDVDLWPDNYPKDHWLRERLMAAKGDFAIEARKTSPYHESIGEKLLRMMGEYRLRGFTNPTGVALGQNEYRELASVAHGLGMQLHQFHGMTVTELPVRNEILFR